MLDSAATFNQSAPIARFTKGSIARYTFNRFYLKTSRKETEENKLFGARKEEATLALNTSRRSQNMKLERNDFASIDRVVVAFFR